MGLRAVGFIVPQLTRASGLKPLRTPDSWLTADRTCNASFAGVRQRNCGRDRVPGQERA